VIERLFRFQGSADYDSYTVHYTWHKKRRVIRQLFGLALKRCPVPNPRVFDLGCGDGYDLFMLGALREASKCSSFTGLDLSAEDIAYCRGRTDFLGDARFRFEVRDLVLEPFGQGELGEIILCSEVVEHLEDPEAFLAALARAMPAGALLLLTTPNGSSWTGRIKRRVGGNDARPAGRAHGVGHISVRGRKAWRTSCERAGFRLLREQRGSSIYGSPALDSNRLLAGMAVACDAVCDLLRLKDLSWETLQLYVRETG
jgi:2-polyprenyl-3-methyl-5-hydroxy-6-metoxy-1,4-benzoquinol methylase